MRLTILNRLALLQLLPHEGSLLDIRAVHQLRQALAPSDEEAEAIEAAAGPGGYIDERSEVARRAVDIDVSPRAVAIVQDILRDLDNQKKYPENAIALWDIFFGGQP